ncbi:MAG: hypothetical protein AB7O86_12235 [Porticoccaceae bacterium]
MSYSQPEIDQLLNTFFPPAQRQSLRRLFGVPNEKGGAAGVGVVATEERSGLVRITRLAVNSLAQSVVNGTEYQSSVIYTFPAGPIHIMGATASLAETTTTAIASTINSGVTVQYGVGTAAASAATLATTMQNIVPVTAALTSTVIDVAGAAVASAASTPLNIVTGGAVYLNSAFATTTDVDADGTIEWDGSIVIAWVYLGEV